MLKKNDIKQINKSEIRDGLITFVGSVIIAIFFSIMAVVLSDIKKIDYYQILLVVMEIVLGVWASIRHTTIRDRNIKRAVFIGIVVHYISFTISYMLKGNDLLKSMGIAINYGTVYYFVVLIVYFFKFSRYADVSVPSSEQSNEKKSDMNFKTSYITDEFGNVIGKAKTTNVDNDYISYEKTEYKDCTGKTTGKKTTYKY